MSILLIASILDCLPNLLVDPLLAVVLDEEQQRWHIHLNQG